MGIAKETCNEMRKEKRIFTGHLEIRAGGVMHLTRILFFAIHINCVVVMAQGHTNFPILSGNIMGTALED